MNRKLFWNGMLALLAIVCGIALSIKPWEVYRLQRKEAEIANAQMRKAEQDRVELTRKRAEYQSELGKEELVRNEGYRQKDETPVEEDGG